jgi:K+-sensing histidine kinase KdpD
VALQKFICTDYNIYEGILFHIVQNAIKFAKSGTQIKIKVDLKQESHPIFSGYLNTKVIDEGSGFNIDTTLFNTFALAKSGLEQLSSSQSIGIGLSTSLTLSKALGGDIKIKSKPDKNGSFLTSVSFNVRTIH